MPGVAAGKSSNLLETARMSVVRARRPSSRKVLASVRATGARDMQAQASWLRAASIAALAGALAVGATAARAQTRVPTGRQNGRQNSNQFRDSIPSQAYYAGVEELYRGDYSNAQRAFQRALRGGVKTLGPTGTILWVDSICYHAMLGETFYQWGQPQQALEQFNFACGLYLQYPRWMLRVEFNTQPRADSNLGRVAVPWGATQRQATPGSYPRTFNVAQGQIDNSRQVQQGGVIQQPQYWPVNVVEIQRCLALAIRRRNEILGPLGPYDAMSRSLVVQLSRGGAPPNHWSNAWIDVARGLAHDGVGEADQALDFLNRGALVAGQFDHPLTCIALLEQGRLALDAGNTDAASRLLAEASYSAYVFEDAGVIDDAFRWGALSRLAAGAAGVNPGLEPALAWARRERFGHIACRLQLALAEELMSAGDWKTAGVALAGGQSSLGDARTGVLGNLASFLEAKLDYQQGRDSAPMKLDAAIGGQSLISIQNFQINLANDMFDAQTLPTRSAAPVYEVLLADPSPKDSLLRPLESMAVMKTPHNGAFERWLLAVLDRRNLNAAMEVTDRAKRRRFHYALPWGGRLSAVRSLLTATAETLSPGEQQQRRELLDRFPDFSGILAAGTNLHADLQTNWVAEPDDDQKRALAHLWDQYGDNRRVQELELGRIGLERIPANLSFPPLATAAEIQSRLQPGQALLTYHDTPAGMLGFLFTAKASTHWNCGPSGRLAGQVAAFLRDLGNHDANHEMSAETLTADDWRKSGEKLYKALLEGSSLSPGALTELVIVPDGVTWYVPFEALVAEGEGRTEPLLSFAKVRYAPTAGLAFSFDGAWRRVQRTGIVAGKIVPGATAEARNESLATLEAAVPNPVRLEAPLPAPSPAIASLLDALVVLDDVDTQGANPLAWSPIPLDRAQQFGSLDQWLALPGDGPQRVLLPGMHTAAERGGKAARRRGPDAALVGSELFYASCGLMSAGAETVLLSRWRVGGQSTMDLMREFVQELPHTSAADAWQRSVELSKEATVDPLNELRVEASKDPVELKATHPFFWAGYLVVDSGWRPEEETNESQTPEAPGAEAAPAAVAGQLPAAQPDAEAAGKDQPPAQPTAGETSASSDEPKKRPPRPPTPTAKTKSQSASGRSPQL